MTQNNSSGPQWHSRPGVKRAASEAKPKEPRNYVAEAIAALGGSGFPTTAVQQPQLISAIIVAQALDRLGERLVDAAAVSQYRRD